MGEKPMNHKAVEYGNEMLMGLGVSQKMGGFDLMQNCDLPPPMKVYMRPEKTIVSPSMKHRLFNPMNIGLHNNLEEGENVNDKNEEFDDDNVNVYRNDAVGRNYDKLELLKALRLSQTRAREAEKKIKVLVKEKDSLSKALVDEAKILFAHRQWVRLLELRVQASSTFCYKSNLSDHHHDQDGSCITWVLAFAFCVGIAAIGCTYMF